MIFEDPSLSATVQWVVLLAGVALLPFVAIMLTSFVKVSVVLAILRRAIGFQGVPTTQIIIGISLVLTLFVMAPVGDAMHAEALAAWTASVPDPQGARDDSGSPEPEIEQAQVGSGDGTGAAAIQSDSAGEATRIAAAATAASRPLLTFLSSQAHPEDVELFVALDASRDGGPVMTEASVLVIVPAFMLSELTEAFLIGLLLFLPFLVIDLVVGNLLMSLGMQNLSATAVSLPFKLLLFVLVDGWYLVVRGLVESYQVSGL